jgi:rubrerythrin
MAIKNDDPVQDNKRIIDTTKEPASKIMANAAREKGQDGISNQFRDASIAQHTEMAEAERKCRVVFQQMIISWVESVRDSLKIDDIDKSVEVLKEAVEKNSPEGEDLRPLHASMANLAQAAKAERQYYQGIVGHFSKKDFWENFWAEVDRGAN